VERPLRARRRLLAAGRAGATDPLQQASHLYDDHLLRDVRMQRLQSPQRTFAAAARALPPPAAGREVLVNDAAANRFELRTPFIYAELRGGRTVTLPGVAWHRLCVHEGALRMALKRVDLLHADQPLPAVEFYV
jgi:hypothetical protein